MRRIPQPPRPPIVAADFEHYVHDGWVVELRPWAGCFVWPVGQPRDDKATWVDSTDPEEAVEIVEADRRQPLTDAPTPAAGGQASRRISTWRPTGTDAERVRESGLLGQLDDQAIAAQLGVTRDVVRYVRKLDGIPRVPVTAPTWQEQLRTRTDAAVQDAWDQGLRRDVDIAQETNLSEAAVWAAKKRLGLRISDRKSWSEQDLMQVASYPSAQEAAAAMGITLMAARGARRRAAAKGIAVSEG